MAFGFSIKAKALGILRPGGILLNEKAIAKAITARAVAYTKRQVDQGFNKESDPYGKPWEKKAKPDGRKILTGKTRKLRRSIKVSPKARGGLKMITKVPYASFHETGTSRMPARPFFPDKQRGLPQKWVKQYSRIAKSEIKKALR